MIIKTLKFKNYRCFVDFNIEFDENIITFIGKNGVGKSCIFDGILYALYGFGQSSTRGGKNLIPNSTRPGEVCELEMVFNLDGVDYKVIRRIKGKNYDVEAFLYTGDNPNSPIAERDSGVNKAIEKLLGMDYGTFKMSVFSAQKDLSVFTSLRPEERKVEIRKLLNLEVIKEAIKLAREDVKKYKNQIEVLENQLINIDELKTNLNDLKTNNEKITKETLSLQEQHKKIQDELKIKKEEVEKQSKIRDQVIQLQSQIKQNIALISQIKAQIEKNQNQLQLLEKKQVELKEIEGHKEKYKALVKELENQTENKNKHEKKLILEKQLKELREEYSHFSNLSKNIDQELLQFKDIAIEKVNLQKQKVDLEQEQKQLHTDSATLNTNIITANKDLNKIKERITQLQKLGPDSVCPECERHLGDHLNTLVEKYIALIAESERHIKRLEDQKEQLNKAILNAIEKKKKLDANEQRYEKRVEKYTQLQTKLSDIKKRLNEITDKGKSISDQIKEFGEFVFDEDNFKKIKGQHDEERKIFDKIIALETEIKTIPTIQQELKSLEKNIIELNENNKKLRSDEKEINFDEVSYQKIKELLLRLDAEELSKRTTLHEYDLKKVSNDKDIIRIEQEIKKQVDQRKLVEETKKKITQLESLMVVLEEFEANLLVKVRPMIEEKTGDLLRVTTHGKFSTLELDQDYKPYLHDLDKKYDLERFSGGEQDLVNLCLRIAIADIVAQRSGGKRISFLVLDEIFGSQDGERRLNIITTLQALIGNFRQIFLITHEDIKESMPIVYEITESSRGNSVVSLIN